jgi:hypothetical protein
MRLSGGNLKNAHLLFSVAALMAFASVPAVAATLCPSATTGGTSGTGSYNLVTETGGACPSAAVLAVGNNVDESELKFHPTDPNFPAGLTLGGLTGLDASVSSEFGDQPFFQLAFVDGSGSVGDTAGDIILLLEDQSGNVSGNHMLVDPGTTLFDLYDFSTQSYLLAGQAHPFTLDGLLATDSVLSSEQFSALDIVVGVSGGCTVDCGAGVTVNSLDVNPPPAVPEPGTMVMVSTGLLFLGGLFAFKQRQPSLNSMV